MSAVGTANSHEHLAQLEVTYPKDAPKEVKLLLKSPENSFETKFALNLDASRNLDIKLNLPHLIDIHLKNQFEKDKETNLMKNDMVLEYKFPNDETVHTLKTHHELGYNLKRNGKDKVANFDFKSKFESSRRPFLNHRSLVQFKYRPYKLQELVLEFGYGEKMDNVYKFSRISKIDVQEFKPFKMNSETDLNIVATDFDVDYEIKADNRVLNDRGNALEFDMNLKGKDRSKRAAENGNQEIEGKIKYRNKGSAVDSKLEASLKGVGHDFAWNSELKQVEPQKYEGKITIQTEKDKKIFITHKEEISKPTKEIHFKSEADISYSYKPDKKTYVMEAKKQGTAYILKGEAKKDGTVIFSNDINFESSNGNLKALIKRDTRSYDLNVDNVFRPREATLLFKIKDREYNIKMDREPFKYINLKVDGNENALIKNGKAHLSIMDPTTLNLVTKANSNVDFSMDLFASIRHQIALKIDSPKYNFFHDGDIDLSIVNRRLLWKSLTKKDDREYKFNADIARKGSMISLTKVTPDRTSSVQYSRNGEKIEVNIDTEYLEGKVEGDRFSGKIVLKNKQNDYELESTYKRENGRLVIESVNGKNAKMEAVFSRKEPSKFVLETPNTKAKIDMDLTAPVKTFKLDFDNPRYQKKIDASMEPESKFKYSSYSNQKNEKKERKIEIDGVHMKELNVDIDFPDFKFKVKQPESSKKVEFSYTFNNYTETEEYDFDPHKAYLVNWVNALRQYVQTFVVQN
uniref:Group 14 allergen Blo t 14 n=1 Tax=Blomia tropicalis TaxID=40697 RepID=A7XZI6_BLOTA|nr:group 14 allergen Blo t 14 [Blomia tropicalis]